MTTKEDIEQLFRSHYRAMFLLANRMLHDNDTARDIVHDIFAELLSGRYERVTSSFLMTGVRMACLKHIRSLSFRERVRRLYMLDFEAAEDDNWPDDEDVAKINAIIDLLPEQTRKVVKLRFCSRLKYSEIAEELSVSEVSVYKHLRRAINVIRQKFNNDER